MQVFSHFRYVVAFYFAVKSIKVFDESLYFDDARLVRVNGNISCSMKAVALYVFGFLVNH